MGGVCGPHDGLVIIDQGCLDGGAARIDSQEQRSLCLCEPPDRNRRIRMASIEGLALRLIGEERPESPCLGGQGFQHLQRGYQTMEGVQIITRDRRAPLGLRPCLVFAGFALARGHQGGSVCDEEMRVGRNDVPLRLAFQNAFECLLELGHEEQGATQEHDIAPYRPATGES